MHSLTFTCTHTGRTIETGINTDLATLSAVQEVTMPLKCPHCGLTHRFSMRSGQLDPQLYRPRLVRASRDGPLRAGSDAGAGRWRR